MAKQRKKEMGRFTIVRGRALTAPAEHGLKAVRCVRPLLAHASLAHYIGRRLERASAVMLASRVSCRHGRDAGRRGEASWVRGPGLIARRGRAPLVSVPAVRE